MGGRVWGRAAVLALGAVVAGGCNDSTAPESFDTGSVEFEWMVESGTTGTVWTASGTCGSRGFDLGSSTCAVGSNEGQYWAALGVMANADNTYDTVTIVHPPSDGSCEATFTPGSVTTCTVEFVRGRVDFPQEPVPQYVMTSGTITVTRSADGERLTGTFEGTAEDLSELALEPIVITGGGFDVDFVGG